jgi:hypothetical protein
MSVERIAQLGRERWEWSSMGVEVGSTAATVAVIARSDLSPREQAMFVGWLVMQATEYGYRPAKATLAKFRKLQRELSVVVQADQLGGMGFSSRLDWDSGTEVLSVA